MESHHRAFCVCRGRTFRPKLQCGSHNGLNGMHTVFRFVKYDGLLALEYFVGNFHTLNAKTVIDLLTDDRTYIVECGQTVHKPALRACFF